METLIHAVWMLLFLGGVLMFCFLVLLGLTSLGWTWLESVGLLVVLMIIMGTSLTILLKGLK